MIMKKIPLTVFASITLFLLNIVSLYGQDAQSANQTGHYPKQSWGFIGPLGTYDMASVQRGYMVYRKACASCHTIKYMRYADLQQTGLTLEQIDKLAAMDRMLDGKDAQGLDHYRAATVEDFLPPPYANDMIAKNANVGKLPLDLSRYAMTVGGQADYITAILLGYRKAPESFHFDQPGFYYNIYAAGHQIAMPPPLTKDGIKYTDGVSASIEQQARDVATFLSWTAHPHLVERHRIGIMIFIYGIFVAILIIFVKRKVWSNVK
ncbi:cytochrome c1 [Commensalibacter oyaizuii]|uniref:Cytochrome c1 n=1 Tax=Commensalibacter oyaizuii TaxID=3043873 RepID=A0ABT6PYT0_9PROT|nr:cytochrome c1 [Commensalibacter sp. TBRC 16381]MDI2090020.1 cytochrome c1 [Commensalibacter sp. TBRC 16381]